MQFLMPNGKRVGKDKMSNIYAFGSLSTYYYGR